VNCPDDGTDHCYQLRPGVVQTVRALQTSGGEEYKVDIATGGAIVTVRLRPASSEESALIRAGQAVTIEWYVGSVATVWISGKGIPTSGNLAAFHDNYLFLGGILIWIGALFGLAIAVNRRMAYAVARTKVLPTEEQLDALAATEAVQPTGATGWQFRPRLRETLLVPLLVAVAALISVRPLMNPDWRWIALAADVALFGPIAARMVLSLRHGRVIVARDAITLTDEFSREKRFTLDQIGGLAAVAVPLTDWPIPALIFLSHDREPLFVLTSLYWKLDEITAACGEVGLSMSIGFVRRKRIRADWGRRVRAFGVGAVTFVLLSLSVLPLPPSSTRADYVDPAAIQFPAP
jgi:hypothetical protein